MTILQVVGWILVVPTSVIVWGFSTHPTRFGLAVILMLVGIPLVADKIYTDTDSTKEVRSFFGVYKVYHDKALGINIIKHGTTVHGTQKKVAGKFLMDPLVYYHRGGPFGEIFSSLGSTFGNRPIAAIGLGAGTIACYGAKESEWTFYEIDAVVEEIAKDAKYFTYLRDCPPKKEVIIGDARLKIQNAPDHYYEAIIIDAFSSDAIPTHLLTKEAFELYLKKLSPTGVIALHLSNRYLDLEPVIGNLANSMSLSGRIYRAKAQINKTNNLESSPATVAILARNEKDLGGLIKNPDWNTLRVRPNNKLWTDDYINILSTLKSPTVQKAPAP